MSNGKGSKRRQGEDTKKFESNFNQIDWSDRVQINEGSNVSSRQIPVPSGKVFHLKLLK